MAQCLLHPDAMMVPREFWIFALLPACLGFNCQSASEVGARTPSIGDTVQTRKKAAATPEMIEKAEQILKENHQAEIGSEYPFTIRGKHYIGRIEEHENASGDPSRPSGKHKGVTVYEE